MHLIVYKAALEPATPDKQESKIEDRQEIQTITNNLGTYWIVVIEDYWYTSSSFLLLHLSPLTGVSVKLMQSCIKPAFTGVLTSGMLSMGINRHFRSSALL